MDSLNTDRRDAIKALLAISAAGALSSCKASSSDNAAKVVDKDLVYAAKGQFLNANEFVFLSAIAQTIIPKTETAGAMEAGVPETLQSLVSSWGDDNVRTYWRAGLRDLNDAIGEDFTNMAPEQRHSALAAYDSQVFENEIENKFYKDMKSSIVKAYYMSEPGATEELHYDPVPGDFKGCVPFSEIGKAWAT